GPLQVAQAAVLVLCHPFSPFRRVPAACPQDTTARTAATARPFSVCFLHQKPPFSLPKAQKKEAASSGPHTVKKVPSSRHVRMDGTHTGKLSAESVRAALRRVRGSALNFVPRDCEAEARPADETAEAEQGQRSAFCKPAATGAAKAGNRNHQGEGISVPRMRAEMGSPWSVALCDTLTAPLPALCGQRGGFVCLPAG